MNHDAGYKRLFAHPELVADLLTGFVREPWIAELDFGTLEKYPTEFIDDRLRQRRNDIIFLKTRLPAVQLPELSELEEIRIMLTDRVIDWTQQWKQEGLQQGMESERRALLRLIRRRFGAAVADGSIPALERIQQPAALEELFEQALDCPDEQTWLARLATASSPVPDRH